MVFFRRQRGFGGLRQGRCLGPAQASAIHHLFAQTPVVPLKHRKRHFFRAADQKKPVARHSGVVDRRVAPALGRLGAGSPAGLHVGAVGIGQAVALRVALAGADHAVERGEKFRRFNDTPGAAPDGVRLELGQTLEPELFDLVEHLGVSVGLVVLVVIIDAKQRKGLIERVDMLVGGLAPAALIGPSYGL